MEDPVAAALARLSKAQAKCAKELLELTASHADSPAWASAGIAAVVRLCHDPAAAADAVAVLGCLSEADDANDDLIREAGAIPLLLTLLIGGPASDVAAHVAWALGNLAYGDATGVAAIIEAGAIPTLAAMLSGGPESTAPHFAAYALQNLASDSEAARAAIVETGAIVPLLALLRGGPESRAANRAAGVLCNLSVDDEGRNAVVEAGAISPLLALLRGGPESRAAQRAAGALQNLSSGTNATAVLEEVARTQIDCSFWEGLRKKLRARASEELQAAEAGSAVAALEHAITLAAAVQVDASAVERAQARLREINGDAERQERRESFGLGSLALPDEFMCPITMDKMRDPVVASDGHSYERSTIVSVLRDGNGLSPLTREPLQATFFPNRALKRRMQEHEEDMLRVAATVVANASDGAQQPGPAADGGEPSSQPAPKRSRRAR